MQELDIEGMVLISVILFAWLTRRRGLVAIQKLSREHKRIYFKEFSSWRWRHYGMLFLLTALPGLMFAKPNMAASIQWALALFSIIFNVSWFLFGYNKMIEILTTLIEDKNFIKLHFADRLSMGLLYFVFTIIAMQKSQLLPYAF